MGDEAAVDQPIDSPAMAAQFEANHWRLIRARAFEHFAVGQADDTQSGFRFALYLALRIPCRGLGLLPDVGAQPWLQRCRPAHGFDPTARSRTAFRRYPQTTDRIDLVAVTHLTAAQAIRESWRRRAVEHPGQGLPMAEAFFGRIEARTQRPADLFLPHGRRRNSRRSRLMVERIEDIDQQRRGNIGPEEARIGRAVRPADPDADGQAIRDTD